jgi:putative hemolysin
MSDIALIGFLILVNGFFAAAEMALVTVRKTRLKALAEGGDRRASSALHIRNNPGDFLSTVQIGITLVGTAASAIGGVGIVRLLAPIIARIPVLAPHAEGIALTGVIVLIAYFTLVFGELVPKRLAMQNAEKLVLSLIGPIGALSRLTYFPMKILSFSTGTILNLMGRGQPDHPSTSPEEIELLAKQGAAEGVIKSVEEELISGVFDYTERRVRDVMTPRTAVVAFNLEIPTLEALRLAKQTGYSRFPVYRDTIDHVLGYVHIKDMIWAKGDADLHQHTRVVHFIPSGASLPEAFNLLAKTGGHLAIVLDEYGGTYGLLTLEDLLEEIVGEIEDEHSPIAEKTEHKTEGEWVFAGTTPVSEVSELLGIDFQSKGVYTTLAGFILASLGKIPEPGDKISQYGHIFSVREMDRLRITSIHVQRSLIQSTE